MQPRLNRDEEGKEEYLENELLRGTNPSQHLDPARRPAGRCNTR
ncbi:MAG: hypothetical protein Q8N18_12400 [Opitutaceae bacterium]|nr:hypothetical protein [Opitutaceae bacterium]